MRALCVSGIVDVVVIIIIIVIIVFIVVIVQHRQVNTHASAIGCIGISGETAAVKHLVSV